MKDLDQLTGDSSEEDKYKHLYENSNPGEKQVLKALKDGGFRLPDDLHKIIYDNGIPVIESDFYYNPNIVVLVHGSVHHQDYVKEMDKDKQEKVDSMGYIVVIIEPNNVDNLISILK